MFSDTCDTGTAECARPLGFAQLAQQDLDRTLKDSNKIHSRVCSCHPLSLLSLANKVSHSIVAMKWNINQHQEADSWAGS